MIYELFGWKWNGVDQRIVFDGNNLDIVFHLTTPIRGLNPVGVISQVMPGAFINSIFETSVGAAHTGVFHFDEPAVGSEGKPIFFFGKLICFHHILLVILKPYEFPGGEQGVGRRWGIFMVFGFFAGR